MPALPGNTYRTKYGYQFRIVVPEQLRSALGKREIKKSLGNDYQTAVSKARLLALQVDRQFAELRQRTQQVRTSEEGLTAYLAQPPDKRLKPITQVTPELISGLKSLWLASLEADLKWRRSGLDDEEYDELQATLPAMKENVAQAIARGRADHFIPLVRSLLVGRGYELAVSEEDERQLVLDILPALQEGCDILEQRQAGRLASPAKIDVPPLPASWEPEQPAVGFSWKELLKHWQSDRPRPARTVKDAESFLDALKDYLPKATPATLTRAQVTEWLRHERETRGNSASTIEKKGNLVGAMFSIAVKDELLDKNPFTNFDYSRFAAREGIQELDAREPFTRVQLKRIFSAEEGVFSITKKIGGGGYHARVWIPLIALYTGARLDEIGSLTTEDILQDPVPHLYIRRGKTHSSVRQVPLHPDLIKLGLLDYVDAIRTAGHSTLWPHLKSNSTTVSKSEVLGKWFNRFIRDVLKMPATVVFHSFRHTFKDLCRDALIPRDLHHELTGHASDKDEKNVGDDYGNGFSLETKLAQIRKIDMGFDITKPHPWGNVEND